MAEDKKVDFGNQESCKEYLVTKFDDLFQGINNLYGKELMEELLHRMEKTVATFHQDVKILLTELKPTEEQKPAAEPTKPVAETGRTPAEHSTIPSPTPTEEDDWAKHLG
ncbi:MAG: hypothetical protein M0R34_03765 [Candidatus Marinimicrobia bacterium]|jgi:hypothetical protein|nr:hypothetical protein [Candidatus Neomarinimicrobiota bacterium]MCK9483461.1 hypothetical protein [Candidatus Neomarinimicrobiota bacterium]MCK9560523.1 hypothetical protein [Candidatus Neomarinimicrobiota bacterium]MDD5061310.1 hypothetical protein [Candidatus Neomarinimicrobiota bacterium]MDD5230504.1 hypothetical protein [Candidatus Neomarinimicrobiota bacterium]